ncbi:hypothetical protein Ahy_B09g098797 [Arachis hypogaea]|uniref:Aminotransferase-like plant mobile domain-containing protein n=1 Tax=Arachis hypogaea TaxID=3818 RepID=A0A444XS99_ARAHY|nr:hypothetical protein Ahy_B09g098797 [Arachis hypogaea]
MMARQTENDGDINKLNETTHYAGVADFKRPRLLLPRRVNHTLPPPDAIFPYLAEAGFGDTVPLKNFTFDNSLILTLVERWRLETHTFHLPWYHTETWALVEQLLGARPPVAAQQVEHRKESFTLKLVWLRDRVYQMPPTDDLETLQQTLRSVGRFSGACCASLDVSVTLFGGTAGCHGYRWLHSTIDFAWRVYDDPAMQALCPPWFCEEEEWGTWLSVVPLLCFNIVRFHHVDRVKRQFNGEQQVPGIPVNLDRYLTTTGRGEDVWWSLKLKEWYDRWHQRFDPGHRITVHHTFDTRPTLEYYDWWRGACRVRHLSGQEVLEDPRLAKLPPDVQPTASQSKDNLAYPRGVPDRSRRARKGRDDTRRPARRDRGHRERRPGVPSDEEAEYAHQEEHGDIAQDREASPPPPPPPPSHGAWHASGSGGQQPLGD